MKKQKPIDFAAFKKVVEEVANVEIDDPGKPVVAYINKDAAGTFIRRIVGYFAKRFASVKKAADFWIEFLRVLYDDIADHASIRAFFDRSFAGLCV